MLYYMCNKTWRTQKMTKLERMKTRVLSLIDENGEAHLIRKRDGREFLVKCYSNQIDNFYDDTWFLYDYDGCDLVIGDVTLSTICYSLLNTVC